MRPTPKRAILTSFLCLAVAGVVIGCSRNGRGDDKATPPPPAEDPDKPALELGISIGVDPMPYGSLNVASCLKRVAEQTLPSAPRGVVIDGDTAEWSNMPIWPGDPVGDAPADIDLAAVAVGRYGSSHLSDLMISAVLRTDEGLRLDLEFGGLMTRQGVLISEVRQRFRVQGVMLLESVDGQRWVPVPQELGYAAQGASGIEVWLSQRVVGDVVTWPVWWMRAQTSRSDASPVIDSTTAAYFTSLLGADSRPFEISTCTDWSNQNRALNFLQIEDSPKSRQAAGYHEPLGDKGIQLVRFAFEAAFAQIAEQSPPFISFPVISTIHTVPAPVLRPDSIEHPEASFWPHRGYFTELADLRAGSVVEFPQGPMIDKAAGAAFHLSLRRMFPEAPHYLIRVVEMALRDHLLRERLGLSYWFDRFRDSVQAFLAASDHESPDGLTNRFERLSAIESKVDRAAYAAAASAKISGLGHLLAGYASSQELMTAWRTMAGQAAEVGPETGAQFILTLAQHSKNEAARIALPKLVAGWLTDAPYDVDFTPQALDDRDADGLPDFVERIAGTAIERPDSDEDGWSDMAEMVSATDPLGKASHPEKLISDGLFNDWLGLLPTKINLDKGRSGLCPIAADVTHYAAITSGDHLLIGAMAADFWQNEPQAKWEATIDFPNLDQQFVVTARSGSRVYELQTIDGRLLRRFQRATPTAQKTIEWLIDRQTLGFGTAFTADDLIRIRLRTVLQEGDKDQFCDETSWFAPIFNNL